MSGNAVAAVETAPDALHRAGSEHRILDGRLERMVGKAAQHRMNDRREHDAATAAGVRRIDECLAHFGLVRKHDGCDIEDAADALKRGGHARRVGQVAHHDIRDARLSNGGFVTSIMDHRADIGAPSRQFGNHQARKLSAGANDQDCSIHQVNPRVPEIHESIARASFRIQG
ncbi:hypothetical protein ABIB57_000223 [Devosia sp. UYZn731]